MLSPLVIEYVFEGHKRGYNFTSPTRGYDDTTLKQIWRQAIPRGQGWGAYIGAHSVKCFPLDDGRVAVSTITVTDLQDEHGRRGIRRAEIEVMTASAYVTYLEQRLESYSTSIRARAEERLTLCKRTNIINKTLPRFRRNAQLILVRPFKSAEDWQITEVFVLRLALEPVVTMRRWGRIMALTTLALDYRDEARMVAVPAAPTISIDVPSVSLK